MVFDAVCGVLLWYYDAGQELFSSPAVAKDGTVYVGCQDDKLRAIVPPRRLDPTPCQSGGANASAVTAAQRRA
jgi:outer membrane protein assembly factor BamB